MRRIGVFTIAWLVLAAVACAQTANPAVARIGGMGAECGPLACSTAPLQRSTVRVVLVGDSQEARATGSLVAIDDSRGTRCGLVLTCAHVLKADWQPNVVFPTGEQLPAQLIGSDAGLDCAVFEVVGVPRPTYILPLADEASRVGEPVRWEGYADRTRPFVQEAKVSQITRTHIRVPGQAPNGTSGGPIYGQRGLQSLISEVDNANRRWEVSGPCILRIRQWLAGRRIRLNGTEYRRENGQGVRTVPIEPVPDNWDALNQRQEQIKQAIEDLRREQAERLERREDQRERLDALEDGLKERQKPPAKPPATKPEPAPVLGDHLAKLRENLDLLSGRLATIEERPATGIVHKAAPSLLTAILPGFLAALGWTGPPAIAAIFGLKFLGLVARRRVAKRRRDPSAPPGSPSSANVDLRTAKRIADLTAQLAACRRRSKELEDRLAGAAVDQGETARLESQLAECRARRDELVAQVAELEGRIEREYVVGEMDLHRRAYNQATKALHTKDPERWKAFIPSMTAMVEQFHTALRRELCNAGTECVP